MIFNYDVSAILDKLNPLDASLSTVKNVNSLSDFGNRSFFFAANSNITLTPSSIQIPVYTKGLYVTTGTDAVIIGIKSTAKAIIAYRNGSSWQYVADPTLTKIAKVISSLTASENLVVGDYRIYSEQLLRITSAISSGGAINTSTNATPVTLADNFVPISAISVSGWSFNTLSSSLYNCTGSVDQNIGAKLDGTTRLTIVGRIRISISTRTGSNPGIRLTLPSGYKLASSFSATISSISYSDAPRNGEATQIVGTKDGTIFDIISTETFTNVAAGKVLCMFVPPTIIEVYKS